GLRNGGYFDRIVACGEPKFDQLSGGRCMAEHFGMAGRRALITGASLSIGSSLALGFADHRASIAIHYSAAADRAFGHPDAAQETLDRGGPRGVGPCRVEPALARAGAGRDVVAHAVAGLG